VTTETTFKKGDTVYCARLRSDGVEVGATTVKSVRKDGLLWLATRESAFGFRAEVGQSSVYSTRLGAIVGLHDVERSKLEAAQDRFGIVQRALLAEPAP
jgi:hypothetical protein